MPYKNKEDKTKQHNRWKKEHYERVLELNRLSYQRNKIEISEKRKINRKMTRPKYKAYYDKNRTILNEKKRKYYHECRKKAIDILGGKCDICETFDKLEFHHLYYALDSRKSNQLTYLEALRFPERFQLLCFTCHKLITFISKDSRGLEKTHLIMERLINSINELKT